jgi:ferredoxin-nitrate reductase
LAVTGKVDQMFKTTCCYCGVGCGIVVRQTRGGKLTVEGDPDHPVNRGMLCSKGLNLHHTAMDVRDRLLVPQVRDSRGAPLHEATWDEALDKAAAVFRTLIAKHGPESVAFYVSGQCLTEEYYIINKLVKGFLGSNNIDTNSRLCMSTAVAAYKASLGEDSVPCSYDDLEAADCWLVTGANPAWCHPILFRRLEARRAQANPGRLIVVDPRRTQTAQQADLHLALLPGTDTALYHALTRLLIENGHADTAFVANHTEGFDELKAVVMQRSLAEYARLCGLDEADLRTAAQWIGEARGFLSLWAMGLNQSVQGTDKVRALINLHLVTGHIGRPGAGPFSLTGQPNAMGGREVGGLANLLSAHRDLANPAHRAEVARHWGVSSLSPKPGLTATEMIDALHDGRLKALWVVCTNPVVSLPDRNRVEAALAKAPFLVVQDVSRSAATLAWADIVLPAATWLEKEGTMTNSERRISHLSRVIAAPGQALPDLEIIRRFAGKMGWESSFDYPTASDVYDEHVALTRGTSLDISGLNYARLKAEGTFCWPVPNAASRGTPRLYTDGRFSRPGGRAQLHAKAWQPSAVQPDSTYPLILTTGRVRDQWHTMTRSGKVAKLRAHESRPFLEIHPEDARRRGLADDQLAVVESPRGRHVVRARLSAEIRQGVVFLPLHWGRVNALTEARLDPSSKEPDLKFQPVQVTAHAPAPRRILVVGAGTAAAAFLRFYRRDNTTDAITVLSGEANAFYNRVNLPHYVEGTLLWDDLKTLGSTEAAALGVTVHAPCCAVSLDRTNRRVTDDQGGVHAYDMLVLATGSRPLLPRVPGNTLRGVLALRTRQDAEALIAQTARGRPVVVVGGGLLALEIAGALLAMSVPVTLVHRSAKLMDRQLDEAASRLLIEELTDRGLPLLLMEEVRRIEGESEVTGVLLASGRRLEAGAVVFATGTVPNAEWAREAGLEGKRGIAVDERLVTSDPAILALGEIAEFRGELWGITPAAEQQAQVAAQALAGDPAPEYQGSVAVNVLKFGALELASVGSLEVGPHREVIVFSDPAQRVYKKIVVEQDRVVGALLLGEKAELGRFKQLIESQTELGDARLRLLRSGEAPAAGTGRVVCSCLLVRESTLAAAGAPNLAALMTATGAGTGCGSCRPELARFVKAAHA